MRLRFLPLLVGVLATAGYCQAPPSATVPINRWTVLINPVCPVSSYAGTPVPNGTSEMRVMYFPSAPKAKLKDPQSLTLEIAFNMARVINNHAEIPFNRKDDHWEAVVPLAKRYYMYGIFYVKSGATARDDNDGSYWDIVFCSPDGTRNPNGVVAQARSYSGENWPLGIHRAKDMNQAVALLEKAIDQDGLHSSSEWVSLWQFKAERDGGDAKAYVNIAADIEQRLTKEPDNKNLLYAAREFVLSRSEKLTPEFVDRMARKFDADHPKDADSFSAQLALNRTYREVDPKKQLAMLDAVIAKYPASGRDWRELVRFTTICQMKDVPAAEASFAKVQEFLAHPGDMTIPDGSRNYRLMAQLYIDKGVKPARALQLLDESVRLSAKEMQGALPAELQKQEDAFVAMYRARAYMEMQKPGLALAQAETAAATLKKDAEAHEILAAAYAAAGRKQQALDEYFNAALLPSNEDLKFRDELKRYYLKNFGNETKYEAELKRRIDERFKATNYVPVLLDKPAPMLEFTTLKGEKFDAVSLGKKDVVINFWSPG